MAIRVLLAACEFLQMGHGALLLPAVLIGLGQPTPPHLIAEAQREGADGQPPGGSGDPGFFFLR
jgi:hypothetical protein